MLISIRAWLQTADEAKKLEQTQLRLLVDNVSLPVSSHTTVYVAIIEAWTRALEALECLIQGAPQRIDNGAVLLGLSSWHLYPDILLAGTNQYVKQGDPLISAGGVITMGLRSRDDDGRGVFWSLPLSHARYYGDPVVTTRRAGVKESQVSFEDFMFVVIGSVLGGWDLAELPMDDSLNLIRLVAKAAKRKERTQIGKSLWLTRFRVGARWLTALDSAAAQWGRSTGVHRQHIARLISFGQRRCSRFLSPESSRPTPVFGLTAFPILVAAFRNSEGRPDVDGQINFLRGWAMRELDPKTVAGAVIRYRRGRLEIFRYTTAQNPQGLEASGKRQKTGESTTKQPSHTLAPHWMDEQALADLDDTYPKGSEQEDAFIPPGPGLAAEPYMFVCGDSQLAAIYVPATMGPKRKIRGNHMSSSQLIRCMEEGDLEESHIATALSDICNDRLSSPYFNSLCALAAAEHIYSKLPGAKVDLHVTSMTLGASKWWRVMQAPSCCKLRVILSCIAYFETGKFDVDPESIDDHTFAICHSSSIYVASNLLSDPLDPVDEIPVERVIGNVGKPGLAFLTTPPKMRTPQLDFTSWHMIAHERFDGTAQDSFQGTSFHISFTGYQLPLDVGGRGGRDIPAYFLETGVSVHDQGKWIADIDVLASSRDWVTIEELKCSHPTKVKRELPPSAHLVSVDTWLELLEPPVQNAVVRAHGNAVARLAAAALATRHYRKVVVLPKDLCWGCQWSRIETHMEVDPEVDNQSDGEDVQFVANEDSMQEVENYYESEDEETYAFNLHSMPNDASAQLDNPGKRITKSRVCFIY